VDAGDRGKLAFSWGDPDLVGRSGQVSKTGGAVGHVVKLRFYLHNATLYGFQAGDAGRMPEYTR
jgi:hypothetical protein